MYRPHPFYLVFLDDKVCLLQQSRIRVGRIGLAESGPIFDREDPLKTATGAIGRRIGDNILYRLVKENRRGCWRQPALSPY
jgi:hypothetical protein